MPHLLFVITQTVYVFLSAMMWLLLARAVLGFFAEEDSLALTFCSVVTEPIVFPVRGLLARIPMLDESPVDFSFMATCLLLILVQTALPR